MDSYVEWNLCQSTHGNATYYKNEANPMEGNEEKWVYWAIFTIFIKIHQTTHTRLWLPILVCVARGMCHSFVCLEFVDIPIYREMLNAIGANIDFFSGKPAIIVRGMCRLKWLAMNGAGTKCELSLQSSMKQLPNEISIEPFIIRTLLFFHIANYVSLIRLFLRVFSVVHIDVAFEMSMVDGYKSITNYDGNDVRMIQIH